MINVQEWLQSLNGLNRLKGLETLPDNPAEPLPACPGIPLSGDLNELDIYTLDTIVVRAAKYRLHHPKAAYRRAPGSTDRKHVNYKDVMALHPTMSIRSAKRVLANIRFLMQQRRNEKITVKLYCTMAGENEEATRLFLRELDEQLKQQNLPS